MAFDHQNPVKTNSSSEQNKDIFKTK